MGLAEAEARLAHITVLFVHGVKPLQPHRWAERN